MESGSVEKNRSGSAIELQDASGIKCAAVLEGSLVALIPARMAEITSGRLAIYLDRPLFCAVSEAVIGRFMVRLYSV